MSISPTSGTISQRPPRPLEGPETATTPAGNTAKTATAASAATGNPGKVGDFLTQEDRLATATPSSPETRQNRTAKEDAKLRTEMAEGRKPASAELGTALQDLAQRLLQFGVGKPETGAAAGSTPDQAAGSWGSSSEPKPTGPGQPRSETQGPEAASADSRISKSQGTESPRSTESLLSAASTKSSFGPQGYGNHGPQIEEAFDALKVVRENLDDWFHVSDPQATAAHEALMGLKQPFAFNTALEEMCKDGGKYLNLYVQELHQADLAKLLEFNQRLANEATPETAKAVRDALDPKALKLLKDVARGTSETSGLGDQDWDKFQENLIPDAPPEIAAKRPERAWGDRDANGLSAEAATEQVQAALQKMTGPDIKKAHEVLMGLDGATFNTVLQTMAQGVRKDGDLLNQFVEGLGENNPLRKEFLDRLRNQAEPEVIRGILRSLEGNGWQSFHEGVHNKAGLQADLGGADLIEAKDIFETVKAQGQDGVNAMKRLLEGVEYVSPGAVPIDKIAESAGKVLEAAQGQRTEGMTDAGTSSADLLFLDEAKDRGIRDLRAAELLNELKMLYRQP